MLSLNEQSAARSCKDSVSGLQNTKTLLIVCLNLDGLGNEMSAEGAGHCTLLLHEYQFKLKQRENNTLLSVLG